MRPTILTIEAVLAAASVLGLVQRRWKALRLAVVLGWFGALPGFLYEFLVKGFQHGAHPGVGEAARGIAGLIAAYLVFAVPLFALYFFGTGLACGAAINRYTQPPAPRWVQPVAVVVAVIGVSVPLVLLVPEFLGASVSSASFWAAVLLLARRWFFVLPEPRSA